MRLRQLDGLERLGQRADLVHFDQDGVRAAELDALRQALGIRHEQVIAHELHAVADAVGQLLPAVPVFLGHAVLDRDDRELLDERGPIVDHLVARELAALARQHVLAGLGVVELGGSRVHREHDVGAGCIPSRLARLHDVLERLLVGLEVRREAALVAHAAAEARVMQDLLQRVVDLGAPAQRLSERGGADRHDHELLEVHVVVGMHAAVQDVHHRRGEQVRVRAAHILVQRQRGLLCGRLGNGQRRAQNGIRAEVALVVGAVDVDHQLVDGALVVGLEAHELVSDLVVHVLDGVLHAFAQVTVLVAVAQLDRLEGAGRCTGRHHRAPHGAAFQHHFHLNRGIAARVENLAPEHIDDHAHAVASFRPKRYQPNHNSTTEQTRVSFADRATSGRSRGGGCRAQSRASRSQSGRNRSHAWPRWRSLRPRA